MIFKFLDLHMKKILFLFILFLSATICSAQESGFGIGIMLGEPTGISGKYWVEDNSAIDFGIAYSLFNSNNYLSLHADYIHHNNSIVMP